MFSKNDISIIDISFSETKLHNDFKNLFIQNTNELLDYNSISEIKRMQFQNGSLETTRKIIDYNNGVTLIPYLVRHFLPEYKLGRLKRMNAPLMKLQISFISPRFFQKEEIIKTLKEEIIKNTPIFS